MNRSIVIKGARVHNLKNVDLEIPRDKLVVFTGLSGSGKSSLAFDTIHAEGHRRFVESLSSYARMFLGQVDKPDVDLIDGLSPSISIDQKTTSKNPRSTVGTVTEIYDYLRLLYARIGVPHCPICGKEIRQQTMEQILLKILELPEGTRFYVLAPVAKKQKGMHEKILQDARSQGYSRVKIDGSLFDLSEEIKLDKNIAHTIYVVVDRLVMREDIRVRLSDSVETALKLGNGKIEIETAPRDGEPVVMEFSQKYACEEHGISIGELEPRMFSFNNPMGACKECSGIGEKQTISLQKLVPDENLSLEEGAITCNGFKSLDEESWYGPLVKCALNEFGVNFKTKISDYPAEAKKALFYGFPKKYAVRRYFGKEYKDQITSWEGIVPVIEKRMSQLGGDYYQEFIEETACPVCHGRRLNDLMLAVTIDGKNIDDICKMSIDESIEFVKELHLNTEEAQIAKEILKEIQSRLNFLQSVGLGYLSLSRKAGSLSGGEAQRIRLATQIGSALTGVSYVLDEPSIGLHQRDNGKLIATLKKLRDLGNSVLVVEHDEETIESADFIVDVGPGAGIHGGKIVVAGTLDEVKNCRESITGDYLSGRKKILVPKERRKGNGTYLTVYGASENNLQNIDVQIPLQEFVCVTGVSGSGKSSLVNRILYAALAKELQRAHTYPGKYQKIEGIENLDKIIMIDQSPIGRTPRSNPATYTGLFTDIRDLFATMPEAKARGYTAGRFSFNTKGGRCEDCEGDGVKKIEMHFLPDVYVTCETCHGKRYNRETLDVRYKGKNISDVLDMSVEEGVAFFEGIPQIRRKLETLMNVGLGYIKIGQSSTTLSGGEAQRVKLATELSKKSTGKTIYVLDEPTTGLHTADVAALVEILQKLVDAKNTVLVIEHNLDLIKTADYLIDLGPEGGKGGGRIVATGTPEEVAMNEQSYTGAFLKKIL